jgi:hypothetical protein
VQLTVCVDAEVAADLARRKALRSEAVRKTKQAHEVLSRYELLRGELREGLNTLMNAQAAVDAANAEPVEGEPDLDHVEKRHRWKSDQIYRPVELWTAHELELPPLRGDGPPALVAPRRNVWRG